MQVTREDLNPCTIKLTVTCSPEEVEKGFDRALKQLGKKIKIQGFRPGLAPKHLLEKAVNHQAWFDQAANEIVRASIDNAISQEQIKPADRPSVSVTTLKRIERECMYEVKIPLEPVVKLGEYKGLKISKQETEVTDEEVEQYLDELRSRSGKREAITDRGVQEGDIAVVNIKVEGEQGEGRTFMTIAGQTFPDLDAALMGMMAEEMKTLELAFPENFQEKDLAGKNVQSRLTLRSVSNVKLPELDDSFAKELNSDSIDELKVKLRDRIKEAKNQMALELQHEGLQTELLKVSEIHVPDTMWEGVMAQRLRDLDREITQRGMTAEDYAKQNGMTVEEMIKNWGEEAKEHVMRAVAIKEIFLKEGFQLTNEDINFVLSQMSKEYNMPPNELLQALRKNRAMEELRFRAIFRKVMNYLTENAVAA